MLSSFGKREMFPSTTITYPRQRISWFQNQHHRVSTKYLLVTIGCDTGGWRSAVTQDHIYYQQFQVVLMLSLIAHIFSNYLPQRHLPSRLSYLRQTRTSWRGSSTYLFRFLCVNCSLVHDVNHSIILVP